MLVKANNTVTNRGCGSAVLMSQLQSSGCCRRTRTIFMHCLVTEVLTNIVLHITDVEGGGGHGHAQAVFLLSQDRFIEAVLLQVIHAQLTAAELHHYVISTDKHTQTEKERTCLMCPELRKQNHM